MTRDEAAALALDMPTRTMSADDRDDLVEYVTYVIGDHADHPGGTIDLIPGMSLMAIDGGVMLAAYTEKRAVGQILLVDGWNAYQPAAPLEPNEVWRAAHNSLLAVFSALEWTRGIADARTERTILTARLGARKIAKGLADADALLDEIAGRAEAAGANRSTWSAPPPGAKVDAFVIRYSPSAAAA
jgi:hypothetical protein